MATNTFQVILTHEHTDFDALASMLAASMLYPKTLPVLPRQLNRNVRDFLTLYKNHLPFITHKDVPRGHVSKAILVDSRAVNWVKGMDRAVELFIIDHHSFGDEDRKKIEEEDLESEEIAEKASSPKITLWTEQVGANTTLLVERLMERSMPLSPVQATLLALGIHEDTGSLTYPSTTHRDARALAWLLEDDHNVNIEVISDFLSHPLSQEQRRLLQELLDSSEFVEVAGHSIVIAQTRAQGFQEEISALATRLRDFHETDAVFLVIELNDITQVVARSTTDAVNVGKVAEALGGGGHTRAAAAPIPRKQMSLQAVRNQIITLLEELSSSAVTVRHIMSRGRPQSLSPQMPVDEAAVLMRRYGHEGFPVIRQASDGRDEILGVLTRREADRAINHGLGSEPVSRFMDVGAVTIQPQASVNELRHLMIQSGWGQIPVVDEEGMIVGIVTRTDLIKLWDEASLPREHASRTSRRLRAVLPPSQHALLQLIGREVDRMGYIVYVVGGFVRDLLLEHPDRTLNALDMDIVIEGNAIQFAEQMTRLYGGRVVAHKRFSTAKWLLDEDENPLQTQRLLTDMENANGIDTLPTHLDFVTARTEFYTEPTALPTVEDSSIKLDLHRRDFTINTLAVCLNPDRWGELLDFYGGMRDLEEGVIRVLHSLSFVDDPTRILRALRYEQRFDFTIDARTIELLQAAVDLLERISPARIRHELERILQEKTPEKTLLRLDALSILQTFHPRLGADQWTVGKYQSLRTIRNDPTTEEGRLLQAQPIERLYWGILIYRLSDDANQILIERLSLRGETQTLVKGLSRVRTLTPMLLAAEIRISEVVFALDKIDPNALALLCVIHNDDTRFVVRIRQYLSTWRHIKTTMTGHDLQHMGLQRGPRYREVLFALRAAWLDGKIETHEQERELARTLIAAQPSQGE